MTAIRRAIPDFQLANPMYVAASVTFWLASEAGAKTATKATLYAAPTGSTTVANPQTLDAEGKFSSPVYIEQPVIAEVEGPNVTSHETGVISLRGTWRGDWATATTYFSSDLIQDAATANVYVARDDYTAGASIAADVAAGHLELVIDLDALLAALNVVDENNQILRAQVFS